MKRVLKFYYSLVILWCGIFYIPNVESSTFYVVAWSEQTGETKYKACRLAASENQIEIEERCAEISEETKMHRIDREDCQCKRSLDARAWNCRLQSQSQCGV